MTEQLADQPPIQVNKVEMALPYYQAFETSLEMSQQLVPELQLAAEQTRAAGHEIIDVFGIRPELFDDSGRAIVFSFIADRWGKLGDVAPDKQEDEKHFLADATALLAHNFANNLTDAHSIIDESGSFDEPTIMRAYDKYTNTQLSVEMQSRIEAGLLNDVKGRLGITRDNEDPYEVRVLSIDGMGATNFGLGAPKLDWDNLPKDFRERQKLIDEHKMISNEVNSHFQELEQRSKDFAAATGREDVFAMAWVSRAGGRAMLCLSQPLAEKILDPGLTDNKDYYDDDFHVRDFAILEHEYTHTQGGLNLDHSISFGINLEEVRAEHYSGNKQGYQDVKGLFTDLAVITDKTIREAFDGSEKGGTAAEMYSRVANNVGLSNAIDVLLAVPLNYVNEQSNHFMSNAFKYIGGYDGIMTRLIDREIAEGRGEALDRRINERLELLNELTHGDIKGVLSYRKGHGLNVISDILLEKSVSKQAS